MMLIVILYQIEIYETKNLQEKIARSKETPPPGPEPTMLDIDLKPVTDQQEAEQEEELSEEAESTVDLDQVSFYNKMDLI